MAKRKELIRSQGDEPDRTHPVYSKRRRNNPSIKSSAKKPSSPSLDQTYIYDPLPQSRGHVRLLKIFPEEDEGWEGEKWIGSSRNDAVCVSHDAQDPLLYGSKPLQTSLVPDDLATHPRVEYTAISHVWDNEATTTSLQVDGESLIIAQDTACLLQRLRWNARSSPVYVWMDTICINQDDLQERAYQVQQMDLIYRKAANVTIWLGEFRNRVSKDVYDMAAAVRSLGESENGNKVLRDEALQKLLEHPWFGRMWVVQEAALARTLTVRLGDATCDWEELWSAADHFDRDHILQWESIDSQETDRSHGILGASYQHYAWLALKEIRETVQAGCRNLQIAPLLLRCKQREATDDRDKIYGVLGLLTQSTVHAGWTEFVPDYSARVTRVYKDFTLRCIEQTGNLDILSTGIEPPTSSRRKFPSWVIDWSNKFVEPVMGDLREPPRYTTGMHHAALVQCHAKSQDAVLLKGVTFDAVAKLTENSMVTKSDDYTRLDVWSEWREMLCGQNQKLWESFWTAIVTDTDNSVLPTNPIYDPSMCLLTEQTITDLNGAIDGLPASDATRKRLWYFAEYLLARRKPFVTARGHLGLAHPGVKVGDKVCVLLGGRTWFLLREVGSLAIDGNQVKSHRLIDGRGYVQDLMYGEWQRIAKEEGLLEAEICII